MYGSASNEADPLLVEAGQNGSNVNANAGNTSTRTVSKPKAKKKAPKQGRAVLDKMFSTAQPFVRPPEDALATKRKSFVYTMLDPRSRASQATVFKWTITAVIVLDLVTYIISTEPTIDEEEVPFFYFTEAVVSTVFLLEYIARLYTITENKNFRHPVTGRLKYIWQHLFSFTVDTVSTLPFFIERFTGIELPRLSFLRALRLLRIMKTNGMVQATDAVRRVIFYNRQILFVAAFLCLLLVVVTSILMYLMRPREPFPESEQFESIMSTMYLSTLMLTGQGGPEGDLPWYTKGVVLLTGVFSIGMFAIPASMLTWGFEAEAERCAKRAREVSRRRAMGEVVHDDDYSTDEEYQKIIAGEESDSEDDDEDELIAKFSSADADHSGAISLTEFMELRHQEQKELDALRSQESSDSQLHLSSRLTKLETQVQNNTKKLDKMFEILQSINKKLK